VVHAKRAEGRRTLLFLVGSALRHASEGSYVIERFSEILANSIKVLG
jgi:hypothetical protein